MIVCNNNPAKNQNLELICRAFSACADGVATVPGPLGRAITFRAFGADRLHTGQSPILDTLEKETEFELSSIRRGETLTTPADI